MLGASGVAAFTDHDDRGSDANAQECIDQATDEILLYVYRRYGDAAIQGSRMLKRWCVVLACVYLCERRGNPVPESLLAEAQRIMETLEKIRIGKLLLPGVPVRSPSVPAMSNLHVDRRYPRSQVRVTIHNSSVVPLSKPRDYEGQWYDI
jgi:phage gp36-like protein